MPRRGVLVIGSANMDLVAGVDRFPLPGETVFGGRFGMFPGGKGANQAVACARLGSRTWFVGRMGRDVLRERLLASMKRDGIRLANVRTDPRASTGMALITVDRNGQNEIVVLSGSNMNVRPPDIDAVRRLFPKVAVVLLQLEIPVPAIARAVAHASACGAIVLLNPAPAAKLPLRILKGVDVLTPNQTEAAVLTGRRVNDPDSAARAAGDLLRTGVRHVVITMGEAGCLLASEGLTRHFPAPRVGPVDTTAAGDAFNGALAHALSSGLAITEALPLANRVAALAVTKMGAQDSMPTMREVRKFFNSRRLRD